MKTKQKIVARITSIIQRHTKREILLKVSEVLISLFEHHVIRKVRVVWLNFISRGRIGKFIHLRDLSQLSPQEFERACSVVKDVQLLRDQRSKVIMKQNLDTDIAMPAGAWVFSGPMPIYELFEIVTNCDYKTINNLRLYSYNFSGFYLADLATEQGCQQYAPPNVNDDLYARLDAKAYYPTHIEKMFWDITRRMPRDLVARMPKMLGEIGWEIHDGPVNTDTLTLQVRLNMLYETGIISWLQDREKSQRVQRILDIGAGIGNVEYCLSRTLKPCKYVICDIPESLLFSALYLHLTLPDAKHHIYNGDNGLRLEEENSGVPEFIYVPNYLFDDLNASHFDLVLNFGSFEEMSRKQVLHYSKGIAKMIDENGILLELNPPYGCNAKHILSTGFPHRHTIPFFKTLVLDGVDIWSNIPLLQLISPDFIPFKDLGWDVYWRFRQWAIRSKLLTNYCHWQ